MTDIRRIEIPVPYLGSVNLWLLEGTPLTLVDTGPGNGPSIEALEAGLAEHGYAIEDLEQVLLTHHHLDHTGLTAEIRRRSGARVAASAGVAAWGKEYDRRVADERAFTLALLESHGVPPSVIEATGPFFDHIVRDSAAFETDQVLAEGAIVAAGRRSLRVVSRPGHSTTDTLFVDASSGDAFVGDHLLAEITSGAEIVSRDLPGEGRRRSLLEFLASLRLTREMTLATCYPGHGPTIGGHRRLIDERLAFHEDRLQLVAGHVRDGGDTGYEIARRVWGDDVAVDQAVLAIWEIVGHLDLLVERGVVVEQVDRTGLHHYRPASSVGALASTTSTSSTP